MYLKLETDRKIALLFTLLTIAFLVLCLSSPVFLNWVFERHHNQLSWYIRPLFLIPFCYFAYKHSLAGISITIFCLFTSMFWFNKPEIVSPQVQSFLQFEKNWLYSEWTINKIVLLLTVPISMGALALALWKKSLLMALGLMVLMATGKIIWSIQNAGDAGKSILVPAVLGLGLCLVLVWLGFRNLENKKK